MMRRGLAAAGVFLLVGLGCQRALVSVTPTETAAPAAASASVWGEVPKQCA
jgi:hypothetical protein